MILGQLDAIEDLQSLLRAHFTYIDVPQTQQIMTLKGILDFQSQQAVELAMRSINRDEAATKTFFARLASQHCTLHNSHVAVKGDFGSV